MGTQLKKASLKLKKIDADGNSMFRAISDQQLGLDFMHIFYRAKAVEYIRENKDLYEEFIPDGKSFDDYCDWMSRDNVWGGELELHALA